MQISKGMRQKEKTKISIKALKYIVIDKQTNKVTIYRYKTHIANAINISVKTLDRGLPYENKAYSVYLVSNVVF